MAINKLVANSSTTDEMIESFNGLVDFSGAQVAHLKLLADTEKVDKRQYSVGGFYEGATVGGGVFVWDAAKDKAEHNGGTIIAPEALTAWDGTHGNLAGYLDWSGSGVGCFVRLGELISVEAFGALEGFNSSISIIRANNIASDLSRAFTGNGAYVASGSIPLTTSFFGDMRVNFTSNQASDGFKIKRKKDAVIFNVTDLSWMVEGNQLSPLSAYEGYTLCITSGEVLSLRYGVADTYYKNDINYIENGGRLKYPLDCTYTTTEGLTVTLYEPEDKLVINGLSVHSQNCLAEYIPLDISRSHVYIEDFKHQSDEVSPQYIRSACRILKSFDVNLGSKCQLNDADHLLTGSREGYGVNVFISANLTLRCSSFRCKTGLSGRHGVDVRVYDGTWSSLGGGVLDSHWGTDYKMSNLNVNLNGDDARLVGYAGRNLSISNISVYGGSRLVAVRGDTPTLKGVVNISNVTWSTSQASRGFIYESGIAEASAIGDFWGVEQMQPDHINISNINIKNGMAAGPDLGLYAIRMPINDIPRTAPKSITISDIKCTSNDLSGIFFRRYVINPNISQTQPVNISVRNVRLGNLTNNFSIEKVAGSDSGAVASVSLFNVSPLAMRVDVDSCVKFSAYNSDVSYAKAFSSTSLPRNESFTFEMFGGKIGSYNKLYDTFAKISAVGVEFDGNITPLADFSGNDQIIHTGVSGLFSGFKAVSGCTTNLIDKNAIPIGPTSYTPSITCENQGDLSLSFSKRVGSVVRDGSSIIVSGEVSFTPTFTTASGVLFISMPLTPYDAGLKVVGSVLSANFLKGVTDLTSVSIALLSPPSDGVNARLQYTTNNALDDNFNDVTVADLTSGSEVKICYSIRYEV